MNVKPITTRYYEEMRRFWIEKNKANQSQSLGIGAYKIGTKSVGFGGGACKSQEPAWCGGIMPGKYVKNRRFGLSALVYIGVVRIVIV